MKTQMEKKREYSHEDMETLGREIEVLRLRARQVDQDIKSEPSPSFILPLSIA